MNRKKFSFLIFVIIILISSLMCVDVTRTPSPPQQTAIHLNSTYVYEATMSATYESTTTQTPFYVSPNTTFTLSIEEVTEGGIIEVTPR